MQLLDPERRGGPPPGAPPSPERIFETLLFGHLRADALKTAIDLDLFTAIAEGVQSADAIAARCGAATRGIRTLCDFLVVDGFLAKRDGAYSLTPDTGVFLDRRSPPYMGTVAAFMAHRHNAERSASLPEAVRAGTCVRDITPGVEDWVIFARSMVPMAAPVAAALASALDVRAAGAIDVLDVAAGHGEFGIAVARANADARIVALDFKDVLEVASERARDAGVEARYTTLAGDALNVDLGGPYDVVLIPNFLHHFPLDVVEAFLRKVSAAMKPGGRLGISEFVPNDDRVSPRWPAMFSLVMLAGTRGDAYTLAEYERVLGAAGFERIESKPAPPTPQTLILARRR